MRRNIKNDKVLRAITIGLATMIAVTSSPLTVLASDAGEGADPNPVEGSNTPSEPENEPKGAAPMTITSADIIPVDKTQITAGSVSSEVAATVNAAEGQNDAEKNGAVITNYNEGVQAVQNADDAMAAARTFEQEVQSISDKLDNNLAPTPGGNGQGQITKAINLESNLENPVNDVYVGVKTDENGNVIDTSDLDTMISDANEAIEQAEKDKKKAYKELKAAKEVASAADTAIDTAKGLKKTADSDTTAANEASDTIAATRTTAEGELDKIRQELETAVNQTDISGKVTGAGEASATALKTAVDELKTAQTALTDAQSAADEAQRNSSSYNRQQMINVATRAQNAANNAKSAAEVTELALKAAKDEEEKAKKAVSNAQTAYNKAIGDATEVLKGYKAEIDRINGLIDTANGSREEAKKAMKAANEAIDAALKLMHESDGTVTSANTAAFAYKTALESIKTANDKIQAVTGLNTGIKNAEKYQRTALMYIDGNGSNMYGLANELKDAKEKYDNAIEEKGTVEENKAKADAALAEINRIIDGIEGSYKGFFDMCKGNVDQDILDLKALLATGKTYKELTDAVETAGSELETASGDLVAKYIALKNIESTEKTAGDIKTEYETALGNQSTLDSNYSSLNKELEEKEGLLSSESRKQNEGIQARREAWGEMQSRLSDMYLKYEEFSPSADDVKYVKNQKFLDLEEAAKETEELFICDTNQKEKHSPNESSGTWVTMAEVKEDENGAQLEVNEIDKAHYLYKATSPIGDPKIVFGEKPEGVSEQKNGGPTYSKRVITVDGEEKTVVIETQKYTYTYDETETESVGYNSKNKEPEYFISGKVEERDAKKEVVKKHIKNLCPYTIDGYDWYQTNENGRLVYKVDITYNDGKNDQTCTFSYNFPSFGSQQVGNNKDKKTKCSYKIELKGSLISTTSASGEYTEEQAYDCTRYTKTSCLTADAEAAAAEIERINKIEEEYLGFRGNWEAANKKVSDAEKEMGILSEALYGKGGSKENPLKDSLQYNTNAALTAKTNNKNFTDGLGSFVSNYNTKSGNKTDADTALSDADKYEEGAVAEARAARTRIVNAENTAKGFRTDLTGKVATLKTDIEDPEKNVDALTIYQGEDGKGGIFKRINDVRNELILVKTKLTNIKAELDSKKGDLAAENVDTIVTLKNGNTKNIETINNNLLKKVDKYKKFKPKKYGPLDYVESGIMNLEVLTVDLLDESLAVLISSTGTFLATQNENLTKISGQIAEIETILNGVHRTETDDEVGDLEEFEEVDGLWDIYNKAQAAADRAAKALANWRAPSSSSGEENDGDDDDSSSEEPGSGDAGVAVTGTIMASAGTIPVIPLPATAAGVAGARTGRRTSRSGVAGVRVDNGEGDGVANGEGDASKNVVEPKAVASTNGKDKNAAGSDKKLVKLENNKVPLADKPFEEGTNMNLLWLLAAATAAGAGAYGYGKHRKNVAAADEVKKYKKN